ncbi:TniB family NTP-binding protein [Methylotenera mobilis]|uniref:TniB family protein n=1 Tax=Methylotenera mobilis (strain JLW8 / ATCC BAA-1282 / DSM 17540) TaxID=583345 RepID=C6WY88_METML|nr:TniB family NTP-binding protein [Methylotenera mobilis]ACT46984.1 TniB family protein [Methylotenera mobilis JLW8]
MDTTTYIPVAVDQILVPHHMFNKAKDRIENHLLAAQSYQEPICIAVIGDSRAGKSRLLEYISKKYSKVRTADGVIIPMISIKTPAKPTVKGLVEIMLREIGDPLWFKRGSETEKTEQLYILLKQAQTHTLIIDEFQHFYDKVSHKVQHYLSDWLKNFVDRTGLMIIVAGLPDCMAVINQNEQLRGRFLAPIHMPRFVWGTAEQCEEFMDCLESFQLGLSRYDFPELGSEEVAFRFFCATGGLIGYIAKILYIACLNAQMANTQIITMHDLAKAYEEAVWMDEVTPMMNPFSEDFDASPVEYLLEMAKQVGTACPEVSKPRATRSRKSDLPSAASVLAA